MQQISATRNSSNMACSMCVRFLMTVCAFLLTEILVVSVQDQPLDDRCTHLALSGCYLQYTQVFWDNKLWPDGDGHLNLTAFYQACSDLSERSSCQDQIAACPPIPGSDFPLQENGYQTLRNLVCDIEAFQDLQRALLCVDSDKLRECTAEPPPEHHQPPHDADGHYCRFAIRGWVCREDAILPTCLISIDKAKTAFRRAREAETLLIGCAIKKSAASSLAPQGLFMGFVTLSMLRWIHAL